MYPFFKRAFDITFSAIVLLALSPLFLVLAALIRLESSGGVFYVTSRVGRDHRPFAFYKFRTMVSDADRIGSAILTTAGDRRITRMGRLLRPLKLDELPQFLNVLKGDMSVVGPRPEVPDIVDGTADARWDAVLRIKPGITCLLQVETFPDFTIGHEGVEDPHLYYLTHQLPHKPARDQDYATRASFSLDLAIIAQTVHRIVLEVLRRLLPRRLRPARTSAASAATGSERP